MRFLLLLSVLAGFWSFISSDSNSTTTTMTSTSVTETYQIQSTNPSPGNTLTKIELNNGSVVDDIANSTPTPPPSTTQGSKQTEMTKNILTTSNQHQNPTHSSALPTPVKPVSTITPDIANGAALGSASAPAVADRETTSIITKSMAVGSSQVPPAGSSEVPKESNSRTPTEPINITVAEIQNASSARTNPTAITGGTKGANDKTLTSTPGNVQAPPANETIDSDGKVKNTTENSSGATGSVVEGTPQSSTTDVAQTSATSNIATGDLNKKTDEPKGNDILSSEETFVSGIGKYLAKQVCSELAKNADIQVFDKCEVQYSPAKDEWGKLSIDAVFKVTDAWMNNILEKVKKESEGLKKGNEGRKEQQSATELKKLIAMVVTGSLLLLVILSAIIYRCSQRKSKHKDPYLTEELRTVDNGCHDNPAMDITDRESEMEEKSNSKAKFLENTDGWIVPMDTHIKDDLEEEDTHL